MKNTINWSISIRPDVATLADELAKSCRNRSEYIEFLILRDAAKHGDVNAANRIAERASFYGVNTINHHMTVVGAAVKTKKRR